MYIPEYFRVHDQAAAVDFMRANSFVILVSNAEDGPFATHLPVVLRQSREQVRIRGHFAKANPHWRYLEKQPQVLTIFHGPHSYISPSLYTNVESVPTWNYGAVHAYGNAHLYSSPEDLQIVLHELMNTFEASYAAQWAGLDDKFRQNMLRQIVGFEISVTKLEAKFKLGQNRSEQDQASMMTSLSMADDTAVSGVARLMQAQGLGICPVKPSGKEPE